MLIDLMFLNVTVCLERSPARGDGNGDQNGVIVRDSKVDALQMGGIPGPKCDLPCGWDLGRVV